MDARAALLRAALAGPVSADNAEAGIAAIAPAGRAEDYHAALAVLLAEGLIREPLRLDPGSLHCHWRLELTPSGRAAARTLTGA